MSAPRASRASRLTTAAWRTPGGSVRLTQCTGYASRAGAAAAVITTSTSCPRSARKAATSGAWEAGPPTSGGQIPETTITFRAR